MRKFILLLVLLFHKQILFSQPYLPLPDSNVVWIVQQDDGGPGQDYYYHFFTSFNKNDTLINANSYVKLFRYNPPVPDTNYVGAYRSNSSGQSFFVPTDSIQEYLLRDFSKNTGDTIYNVLYSPAPGFAYYMLVDLHVDSMNYVSSGSYLLKRMYLSGSSIVCPPIVWIEKIGCLNGGALNTQTCALGYIFLNCMSFNDTTYFSTTLFYNFPDPIYIYGNCDSLTSISEIKNTNIKIYPNPFSDRLFFTLNDNDDSEIIIYDFTARKLLQQKFTNSVSLNTEQLAKGLYLYEVRSKDGSCKKGKVVKD